MTPSTSLQNAFSLAGRILIAVLFVPIGWGKITGFAGTVGYIASHGVPLPEVCAVIGMLAELGLPLLLLLGFKTRWAALALAVYVLLITPIFHAYWAAPAPQQLGQYLNFYKNLAIVGGLLSFAAFGAGAWSLDARRDADAARSAGFGSARA